MSPRRWQRFEENYPNPDHDTDEDKFDNDGTLKDWAITFPLPIASFSKYQRNRFIQMAREMLDPEISPKFENVDGKTKILFAWRPLVSNGHNREDEDAKRFLVFKTRFIDELEALRNGKSHNGVNRHVYDGDYNEDSSQHGWEKTCDIDIKYFDDAFLARLKSRAREMLGSEVSVEIEEDDSGTKISKILFEWVPANVNGKDRRVEDHIRFLRFNTWLDVKLKFLKNIGRRDKWGSRNPKSDLEKCKNVENVSPLHWEMTFDVPIEMFDYMQTNRLMEKAKKMLDPKVIVKIEAIGNKTKVSFEWKDVGQNKKITHFQQLMTLFEEELKYTHNGDGILDNE